MTTLDFAPRTRSALPSVLQLHSKLWRVTKPGGEVLGYIEAFDATGGERYRAKRFVASRRSFLEVGEFWRIDDATDSLRFA
jgi:hypothetical protein